MLSSIFVATITGLPHCLQPWMIWLSGIPCHNFQGKLGTQVTTTPGCSYAACITAVTTLLLRNEWIYMC
jgi:hypothetical protein